MTNNGLVLVAGGADANGTTTNTTELFDPVAKSWSSAAAMKVARAYHTATLLTNGQVLVAGGSSRTNAEIYDPASGTWTSTGMMLAGHSGQTATLLPSGKVLVAGAITTSSATNSCELFDPATGNWSATGGLHTNRWEHTATLLPNGKVLVVGGEQYDWRTGFGPSALSSAELYDPAAGVWTTLSPSPRPHWLHTATLLLDGRVLVAGGLCSTTVVTNACDIYDPASGTWTVTGPMNTARSRHTATLLPGGKVLVCGGDARIGGTPLSSAELYDPVSGVWNTMPNLNNAREHHMATLLPNGCVLIAGGSTNQSKGLTAAELYLPPFTLSITSLPATILSGGLRLRADGAVAAGAAILCASPDLTHWEPLLTNTPLNGSVEFQDADAANHSTRFYKVLQY